MTTGIILGVTFQDFQPDPASRLLCNLVSSDDALSEVTENQLYRMNWPEFARLAAWHSLAGVVYKQLRIQVKQGRIPRAALDELRPFYLDQAAADLRRMHWLSRFLEALQARQLPVIVLKGAYLAETVFADSADRPMADIDLLVRQDDLSTATQTLLELGYHASKDFWLDIELQVGQHLPPFMQTGAPPIEVHWRLFEPDIPFRIDQAGLWQRACPAKIAGQPVLGLCPEDLLLHLCLHATLHRFQNGLRAAYDIAATINHFRESLDWTILIHRSQEWQATRALFIWLWLASDLFGASVPAEVLQQFEPDDFNLEQSALARRLVFYQRDQRLNIPVHLAELVQTPSIWGQIRLIFQQAFLSPKIMARAYPVRPDTWKVLLYYPVRWWSLFRRAVQPVQVLLRRSPQTLVQTENIVTREDQADRLVSWIERPLQTN